MDAQLLTTLRTGASSAVATRRLARGGTGTVAVIGSGREAFMLEAMSVAGYVGSAKVFSPIMANRQAFAAYVRAIQATNADPKKDVVEWAHVVDNKMLMKLAGSPALPENGKIYPASLKFDADLAYQFGYLKALFDTHTVVDNNVVDAALVALK